MVDNYQRTAQFKVAYAHDVSGGYAVGPTTSSAKNRAISSKKIRSKKNKSKANRDSVSTQQPTTIPAQVRQMYQKLPTGGNYTGGHPSHTVSPALVGRDSQGGSYIASHLDKPLRVQ